MIINRVIHTHYGVRDKDYAFAFKITKKDFPTYKRKFLYKI
jgi:hypothetical protein